jgi:hypothetical protein
MTAGERSLCWVYATVALVALVATQWVLADYIGTGGAVTDFVHATVRGQGPAFVTIDLLAVATTARSS